jgi:hypothetical protein
MPLIKLTEAQKQAIKFIYDFGYLSSINPSPVNRRTIQRLLDTRIIQMSKNNIDYTLTKRGQNIRLGL